MSWTAQQVKIFRKEAMNPWGHGWKLLSEREQEGELARCVCTTICGQDKQCGDVPLREIAALIRRVVWPDCDVEDD